MADSTKTQGTEAQPQHATEELRPASYLPSGPMSTLTCGYSETGYV